METLRINKRRFYYSTQNGTASVYESEPYTDGEGNTYYLETGDTEIVYTEPISFKANKNDSGGEAEATEFGLSVTDYEAVMVFAKGAYEIPKGSIIWVDSAIEYKYGGQQMEIEVDGVSVSQRVPLETSADYRVIKVSKSLNYTRLVLKAINK